MAAPLILVVNDDPASADHLRQALAEEGYRTQASRSVGALSAARRAQPALILLGITPPSTAGKVACRRLRADRATRAIPVVAVSPARPETYADTAVDDRLTQPCSPEDLRAVVARWTTVH